MNGILKKLVRLLSKTDTVEADDTLEDAQGGDLAHGDEIAAAAWQPRESGIRGRSFLIIEDNLFLADSIQRFLEQRQNRVVLAENGKVGLEKFFAAEEGFDFVMLDLEMPVMNGHETLVQLRAAEFNSAKTPIILMSGSRDFMSEEEMDGVTLLRKPFTMDDLLGVVEKIESNKRDTPARLERNPKSPHCFTRGIG